MVTGKETIKKRFDIYGISIHSVSTYSEARKVIERVRKIAPKALIVVGGAFPTSMAEYTLKNTEADIVVRGEGEVIFSEIVNEEPLNKIKGISYKGLKKTIHENPPQLLIDNLDIINFPARSLLPRDQIVYEGKVHHSDQAATTIFVTRGCPWSCNYCQKDIWTRKWRCRSTENIRKEIEEIKGKYKIKWFRIPDDNLTANREWFLKFCQTLKEAQVKWTMLSRSDTIDLEMIKKAKESGCQEVFFGFESGSQKVLNLMGRKNTVEQNAKAVEMCKRAGIKSCAYMMFGFPGENQESVKKTMEFLRKVRPEKARLSTFIPIPGTDVWDNPKKYGVTIKSNFSDFWYFDDPNTGKLYPFGVEYEYLEGKNKEMSKLRNQIIDFFKKEGFISGWTKA